jgi:hypothetical protein
MNAVIKKRKAFISQKHKYARNLLAPGKVNNAKVLNKSEPEMFLHGAKLFLHRLNSVVSAASAYFVLVCANL